jgi:hypothetical protein
LFCSHPAVGASPIGINSGKEIDMTTLVQPTTLQLQQAKAAGSKEFRQELSQFRQVFGAEAGTRYSRAGLTLHQATQIHGLTGERLQQVAADLKIPAIALPKPAGPMTDADYAMTLGSPGLGKAAAAIERANPLLCRK